MRSTAEDLKQVPLFSGLSQRQLRQPAKDFRDRRVPAGALLAKQGEVSGVAFFSERERTATVEALTPMRCHAIQFWHFRAFREEEPRRHMEAPPTRRGDPAQRAEPSRGADRPRAIVAPPRARHR